MTENTAVQCCNDVATERAPVPTRVFTPRVDIVENENGVLLYADLPGVRPEDVDLRFEQGELTLVGKVQPRTPSGRILFGEYEVGDFQRVFQVPDTIDAGKIDAEFKNGVLIVHLPKQEVAKPKQVQIRVNN
jgi:HSP20 family protein